ncbi:LysR family transcriptional regulator [Ferrovibrio sp.]|uniref:LysR family transcriptional regulator n=1 Tax=Ferrovibrio sp. TaxID=1917215 RepID=UPI003D0B83A9
MNLNHLRHVVMVYRMGSFTAAAAELNVTQSSVTKSVAWVEQDLGYALFDRRARGVSVTEAGHSFIDRATRIVSDMDRLAADTAAGRGERSAILRIGVAPPSLEGLLNRAIRMLLREPNQFRLHMQASSTQRAITLLGQGDIDLLVGPTDELCREQAFTLEHLPDFVGRIFCRRDHPLLAGKTITEQQIRRYPIITPDLSTPLVEHLVRTVYGVDSGYVHLHIIDNFPMVASIIENTDALGVASSGFARTRTFLQKFRLVPNTVDHPLKLSVARRARWLPSPPMSQFLKAVRRFPPN